MNNAPYAMNRNKRDTITTVPDSSDREIMESVRTLMNGKVFRNASLSLDQVGSILNINRYYISLAINRCTGKNFKTFVNEYRVEEAIRLLSAPSQQHLTMDDIALHSGFANRKNLHRVFRKIKGYPPGEFKNNIR